VVPARSVVGYVKDRKGTPLVYRLNGIPDLYVSVLLALALVSLLVSFSARLVSRDLPLTQIKNALIVTRATLGYFPWGLLQLTFGHVPSLAGLWVAPSRSSSMSEAKC